MSSFSFQKALVKSPKRSRVDLSCDNYCGIKFGAATPTYQTFIVPSDVVNVSMDQVARLAPMPVPTFVDLKVRHDWFFVPLRLLYSDGVYQQLFSTDYGNGPNYMRACGPLHHFANYGLMEPVQSGIKEPTGMVPGTLWDYLGYPVVSDDNVNVITDTGLLSAFSDYIANPSDSEAVSEFNLKFSQDASAIGYDVLLEPLFAYHFIWRDWYRFTSIERLEDETEAYLENGVLDLYSEGTMTWGDYENTDPAQAPFGRYLHGYGNTSIGDLICRLRYPHFAPDGFTSVRYGTKPTVLIPTGQSGTIPKLREASAWQRVIDIFSVAGTRLFDRIKAVFNVEPTGFADDRVQFLARYQSYIKIGEVLTTASTDQAKTGDYAGRGVLIDGKYLFKRSFSEYGWLFCISSVMPNIAYDGVNRQLLDVSLLDTPIPQLAEIGDQTVTKGEVNFTFTGGSNRSDVKDSFGNQFRYYAYKWMPSTVHGCFKMSSMSPWVPTHKRGSDFDVIQWTKAFPEVWNKVFNDTDNEVVYGDRFFFKLTFNVFATRPLPKYINYHL